MRQIQSAGRKGEIRDVDQKILALGELPFNDCTQVFTGDYKVLVQTNLINLIINSTKALFFVMSQLLTDIAGLSVGPKENSSAILHYLSLIGGLVSVSISFCMFLTLSS